MLDRIEKVLFDESFYLGLLKILLQNFFFFNTKKLCYRSLFVSFFEVENQKGPIAIKIHTHKILSMQLNLLLPIKYEKNGMEK